MVSKAAVAVIHSTHQRCGVREYGLALDQALGSKVNLRRLKELRRGDTLLVHYEPGLVTGAMRGGVASAHARGIKIVFCCHWFARRVLDDWPLVTRFVVHKDYGIRDKRVVRIPLACPVYAPIESKEALRQRLGLPQGKVIITTLGFLSTSRRFPELARELLSAASDHPDIFINFQTPLPFVYTKDETPALRAAMGRFDKSRWRLSTEFLEDPRALTDYVYASDMGALYHPAHSESASAAAKQFVSAQRPLVINMSSHASDLQGGFVRVSDFNIGNLARVAIELACDRDRLDDLQLQAQLQYARINMNVVAERYVQLFESLK